MLGITETLLYGDREMAATKLRAAIRAAAANLNAHQAHEGRVRTEHARSMAPLKTFRTDNDAFKDPVFEGAARTAMAIKQETCRRLGCAGLFLAVNMPGMVRLITVC
jgi:hypothetical protein